MAVYQEFTIDQGSDATIELHLVDKNGKAIIIRPINPIIIWVIENISIS